MSDQNINYSNDTLDDDQEDSDEEDEGCLFINSENPEV